jgi:anti-sigma factor RsiW
MNCKETQEVIHGYLDGELDLVRSLELEQHLKDCPTCARAQRSQESLRTAIAGGGLYFNAPPDLQSRVRSAVRQASMAEVRLEGRQRRWNWNWRSVLAPLGATAALLLVALPLLTGHSTRDRLLDEIVSAHVRSLMAETSHLTDVASSNQHTVKPWFTGKLPFAPPVTDLSVQGFPLIGGRLDYVEEHSVAALIYQRRQHFINLFIWPTTAEKSSGQEAWTRRGYNVVHWNEGGMAYWAVSDVNMGDLREFVRLVAGK